MNIKFLFSLFLCCSIFEQDIWAQPIFPPATSAEVAAGVVRSKFVSPFTLGGGQTFIITTNLTSLQISNVVNSAPSGSLIKFGPGLYTFITTTQGVNFFTNCPLSISYKSNIVVEGSGPATILEVNEDGPFICFTSPTNCAMKNLTVRRPQYPPKGATLNSLMQVPTINLWGIGSGFLLENVIMDGAPSFAFGSIITKSYCDNTIVSKCTFKNAGATNSLGASDATLCDGGAVAVPGNNCIVVDSFFTNCLRGVEAFYSQSGGLGIFPNELVNTVVDNCVFYNMWHFGVATVGDAGTGKQNKTVSVRNSYFTGGFISPWTPFTNTPCGYGVILNQGSGHQITGNRFVELRGVANLGFSSQQGVGCYITGATDINGLRDTYVADNLFMNNKYMGIFISGNGFTNLQVRNNQCISNGQSGIYIFANGGQALVCENNVCADNGTLNQSAAIHLNSATNWIVKNNLTYNRPGGSGQAWGVLFNASSSNCFSINNISYNTSKPFENLSGSLMNNYNINMPFIYQTNITWGLIAANTCATVVVPNAFTTSTTTNDFVTLGIPTSSVSGVGANIHYMGFASNAVYYVRACNPTVAGITPPAGFFKIKVETSN